MGLSSGSAVEVSFRVIFSSLERLPWKMTEDCLPSGLEAASSSIRCPVLQGTRAGSHKRMARTQIQQSVSPWEHAPQIPVVSFLLAASFV